MPDLTLIFEKSGSPSGTTETVREKVLDVNQACVYLSPGSWNVRIESRPEKYFIPAKSVIQVPGARFSFQEFSGSISGKVSAQSSSPDGLIVRAENKATAVVVQEQVVGPDGKFSFLALESGDYRIKVSFNLSLIHLCWMQKHFFSIFF